MTTFTEKKAGIIGLVGASIILISIEFAAAQSNKLTGEITEKGWFQKLPVRMRALSDSAVWLANDSKYEESIKTLQELLDMPETRKANRFFRAWLYQWMAFCISTMGNLDTTRYFVSRSLREDFDIWPDQADRRLPIEVRGLYQDRQKEILDQFIKKRKSYRIALGPITRAELGYSHGLFNFAFGIGTTVVLTKELGRVISENLDYETEFFNDLLVFVRVHGMRKNIKRLIGGGYVEFALYSEDFFDKHVKPAKALSGGPTLSYVYYPSLWEFGCSFEAVRFDFGRGQNKKLSRTFSHGDVDVSYGNFEIYIRKWF